jgi:hypothetical protein
MPAALNPAMAALSKTTVAKILLLGQFGHGALETRRWERLHCAGKINGPIGLFMIP